MKRHKFKILSLLAVLALSTALAGTLLFFVSAETTYTASNIFSSSGATSDRDQGYVAYKLSDEGSVFYRKNLALKWYESGEADGWQYFSTTFSFGDTYNFETFTMTMESSQFTADKDEKTTNTLAFTVGSDGKLDVSVNGEAAKDFDEATVIDNEGTEEETSAKVVKVAFTADADGVFSVSVNDTAVGKFVNIGKNYIKYASSSADTPVTPITFKTEMKEDADEGTEQLFVIRELNGQSLKLNDSGSVVDDKAPVLVLNSDVKLYVMGSELDFDYVAIDVLDSSVTTTRYYYAYDAEKARVGFDVEGQDTTYAQMDSDRRFFENDFASTFKSENAGYLSVAFKLSDGDNSDYYFIEWYAPAGALVTKGEYGYIKAVVPDSVDVSPEYTFNDQTTGADDIAAYKPLVEQAAKTDDGKSIQVGSGAYYYIPSLKPYITDDTCGYSDMKFDIYYRTNGADTQSSTGLSYDALKLELTAEGVYEFRIVPSNYLGNALVGHNKEDKEVTIDSSNVWEIKELTTFTFTVKYNGVSIEEPEDADDGYVDVTYTFDSFEIISLSNSQNSLKTEYKLYYLQLNAEYAGKTISAEDLKASLLAVTEENGGVCTYGTWTEIEETTDEDEESPYAESWSASSRSFVPKVAGYFGITVKATDLGLSTPSKTEAAVANVSSKADSLPGSTYWLQNNILSIVFICISAACLIGIVVLLLVKPKNKKTAAVSEESSKSEELKEKRKNRK